MKCLLVIVALLLPVSAFATGGVTSSADPRATAAGQEILRAGGSSTDAAIAMMLTLSVVEPQSSGIGGGGFMVVHDVASGKIATIDGREMAPAALKPTRFLNPDGTPKSYVDAVPGGDSVGIPGNVALAWKAHQHWGKLPWARLFAPAIKIATEGYTVSRGTYAAMQPWRAQDAAFLPFQALFWENGAPKRFGTIIKNPAQAKLLRAIALHGPSAFYKGANADAIGAALHSAAHNPAVMTKADLAGYVAKDRPAVCGGYRSFKICSMGPPSSGGSTVLEILGLLEPFNMKALGKDNPQSWHLITEAMYLAYADRNAYLGDPDFVQVPLAGLLDKQYLARRSALISLTTSLPSYAPGNPPGATKVTAVEPGERTGTTHFVAVDRKGNITSMTSTVEGLFGSQLVANGMVLNNELTDFSFAPEKDDKPVANAPQAHKRPLSSMSPTIVYDASGKPILALGSAGGPRIIMHVAKTLIAALDWDLPAEAAIAEPNLFIGGDAVLIEQGSKLDTMRGPLAAFGKTVVSAALPSKVNAVERTPSGWRGAADPRSEGNALSE